MADIIKSDIEKIERALNIRVEDVALNAVYSQTNSQESSDKIIDISSIDQFKFVTALNICTQRNLFQLYKYFQSINISQQIPQTINEILPIQIFESFTQTITNYFPVNNQSIQYLRRMMQREEKARLTSNEIIEKLIEYVAKNLRENREHQLTRKIEILQISTRDQHDELENTKIMLDNIRRKSNRDLIKDQYQIDTIDWKNISEISMNNQYTETCCRLAWKQICLPMIEHQYNDWSHEEDRLLENLVKIHGEYADQWENIAENFNHRSAYMCANRYMILENNRRDKIKFSSDQIQKLKEMINEIRHGNYIPLNKVAYQFGCSLSTIRREWRNIDPDVRRGQWQVDEDELLLRTVAKQSNRKRINWNLVASEISGRSLTKCYHRYIHLTQQQNKTNFTPNDDRLLIEQHQFKNARWSQIQLAFPGRSCYTLQNRYKKLMQYRQINELFHSQSTNVQSFLLRQFSSKTSSAISPLNNFYYTPNIQLNYEQLKYLTSNDLFRQFCDEIDQNIQGNQIGIRQFLKQLSQCQYIDDIKQIFFSIKSTRKTKLK